MQGALLSVLALLAGAVTAPVLAQSSLDQITFSSFTPSSTLKSTNLTDLVQWDGYSLFVEGLRVVLWSGEVHPFRLPVPGLYCDVMQKVKALGFNAVSFYTFWGLHNPSEGVLDFTGWKDLQPFIDAAHQAGLYLIARPGPYINAEITGGGIPGWVTTLNTDLRTSNATFMKAVTPYWQQMGSVIAQNQISNGGPIIAVQMENEYYLDSNGDIDTQYIADLESLMRGSNVTIPFTFNDASEAGRLVTGQGAVNIYGFDSYPQSSDCTNPYIWPYQVDPSYRPFFQNTSGRVGEPFFIPEFQAGTTPLVAMPGFDQCLPLYSSDFEKVFYLHNLAEGVKMINYYMAFGGTNWGHLAFPRAITTYDYYAPIAEDRSLQAPKYSELKLLGHFVRSAKSLPKTWIVGSSNSSYTSPEGVVQVDELRNPDDNAGFYVVRQANSSSVSDTQFTLEVQTWQGNVTFPITLYGRDSRVIVSNYCWGLSCIAYSSASIFTSTTIGDCDVLVVYGEATDNIQIGLSSSEMKMQQLVGSATASLIANTSTSTLQIQVDQMDHSVFNITGGNRTVLLHVLDSQSVSNAWETVIEMNNTSPYFRAEMSVSALVFGPYLVRSAVDSDGSLWLSGDVNVTTSIAIAADPKYSCIKWNGNKLDLSQDAAGMMHGTIQGVCEPDTPVISSWVMEDSFPEREPDFDDSQWVVANHTPSINPNAVYPNYTGTANLYMQDYGFYVGDTILRGHFNGTGVQTGFNVSYSPGTNGVGAMWLNGEWLGSALAPQAGGVEDTNATYSFPEGSIKSGDNVITILLDNSGLEETDQFSGTPNNIKSPRGLRGYSLIGGGEMEWRLQGNLGGNTNFPDKVRGLYNAGGLYGEREGWYLPGFDDSTWTAAEPLTEPGVTFYRAEVNLAIQAGMDLHYSFVFPNHTGNYRAQLFVNGWQFGRRFGDLGPQLRYPVPPGILHNGTNTLAMSVFGYNDTAADWTIGDAGLTLEIDSYTASSLDLSSMTVDSPSWHDIFGS
ncbi:glycoside hydrolase superfamily [Kockovaella imperatae]|uniref:Beta-galactosidase n=1 Tax=Kockovaella imperatae TaxID=4999 RepID=A0A1Y1U9L7_9TREE|nr:glycoside hydrolase superfamily [Kockovaella imperatae]ORX33785.1 glycoside hydrolase superfamily [Kockovaella imperatae]